MKKHDWIALVIILLFFISGVLTLSLYGLSWDEGLGNLFFGERYLLYLTSFQEKYLDFKADLPYHQLTSLNLFLSPFRNVPYEFPPVTDTLSAASMYLTSYWLDWFDPVEGWHFFTICLSTIFLWILYRFSSKRMGKPAALLGIFFLASFPRFWGDMHFNPKDVPETVFFSLVILLYFSWYGKPSWWKSVGIGVLFALALGTKLNAIFIPVILVIGVWPGNLRTGAIKENFNHIKQYFLHYIVMGIGFITVYYLSWPYLHEKPQRVISYFSYMLSQGGRGYSGSPGKAFIQAIATMPEVMLILLFVGLFYIFQNKMMRKSVWYRLLVIWLLIPLIRTNLPGIANFDGIRHFLEFVPPAALIAGFGCSSIIESLFNRNHSTKKAAYTGLVILLFLNLVQITVVFHPYQHLYYNQFVGGLKGALNIFGPNEATDYWATSYRQGMNWLNEKGNQDGVLYTPVAPWLVELTAKLWLRPDLVLAGKSNLESLKEMEESVYIMFITRPVFYNEIAYYCVENLIPIYKITVDQVDVLEIYLLE